MYPTLFSRLIAHLAILGFVCPIAFGQVLTDLPDSVHVTSREAIFTATLGPVHGTDGYRPSMVDANTGRLIPSITATIWGNIPRGTALGTIVYLVRRVGDKNWQQCTPREYTDPRNGYPTTQDVCGRYANIEFEVSWGNFNCANLVY